MRALLIALFVLTLAMPVMGQDKKDVAPKKEAEPAKKDLPPVEPKGELLPPPEPVKDDKAPPVPAPDDEDHAAARNRPPVEIILVPGEAQAIPFKRGVSYANGGVIVVTQPDPTTLVVTMTGLTATNADLLCTSVANYQFDLNQCFEICFNSKRVKQAKLTLEGRVLGLLRTDHRHYTHYLAKLRKGGTAQTLPAVAAVTAGPHELVALHLPARATSCGDDLSVYNHEGPLCVPVLPGKYTLHETWGFGTTHIPFHCRGASAEFAPQPEAFSAENYWFHEVKPFNGQATKDFGFQVTLKVAQE